MPELPSLTDLELINNVRNNACSYSFEELVNRHSQLYYSVVQKFHNKNPESNLQDLLSDLYIVFNKAVDEYNVDKKAKFSTFLYYLTRFHCLNTHNKIKPEISHDNMEIDYINERKGRYCTFHSNMDEINDYLLNILNKLEDKRIPKIFKRRFIDLDSDKLTSWNRIAGEMGLSVTGTINLYQKGQKYLYKRIYKEKEKI